MTPSGQKSCRILALLLLAGVLSACATERWTIATCEACLADQPDICGTAFDDSPYGVLETNLRLQGVEALCYSKFAYLWMNSADAGGGNETFRELCEGVREFSKTCHAKTADCYQELPPALSRLVTLRVTRREELREKQLFWVK